MTDRHDHSGWRVYALLGFALVVWGSAFAGIRVVVNDGSYSPGQLTFVRLTIAAMTLLCYALHRRVRLPALRDVPLVVLLGFSGIALYHTCLNHGEQMVTAGAASFIVALSPVFAVVFAMVISGDRPRPRVWLGMAISFAGVTLIAMGDSGGIRFSPGALLVLVSAASGGFFIAAQRPLLKKYSATEAATWFMLVGAMLTSVFAPGCLHTIRTAPLKATVAVVYLGIVPGAVAYLVWAYVLARLPVARAASGLYLTPVITVAIALVWPGEMPAMLTLAGGVLALAGVIIVNRTR